MEQTDLPEELAASAKQTAQIEPASKPGEPALRAYSALAAGHTAMTYQNGGKPPPAEAAKIAMLAACERQVITLVGEGLRNQQIAQRLCISETTVRHHLSSIFGKLGVAGRLELLMYAYRHGLAKLPA